VGRGGGRGEEVCGVEGRGGGRGEGSGCRGRRSSRGLAGPQPGTVSVRGQEGCSSQWLHPTGQTSLPGCLKTSVCLAFSPPFLLFCGFIPLLPFLSRSSPSGAVTATGTTAADVVVRVAPGPAPVSEPRTLEGVPEDMVESEGEPEVASEAVPKVVQEEAPAEGAMIAVRAAAAPPSSRGACAPLSSAPRRATASGAAVGEGMEVVLGHPTPYAPGDISVSEVVSTTHQALSQARRALHHEGEDLAASSCGQACSRG
jgi:hypothetical protein